MEIIFSTGIMKPPLTDTVGAAFCPYVKLGEKKELVNAGGI